MDEAVKTTARALGLALLLAAGAAGAQALQDPTRPPAAAAAGYAAAAAQGAPRLQSVLIGRAAGGRHLAVIDGETVRPGDDFHGARVARIGENEVELVRGRERRVLRLYADAPAGAGAGITPVRRALAAPAVGAGALAAQR